MEERIPGKAPQMFQASEQDTQERARIAELERMIGRLTLGTRGSKKSLDHVEWQPEQKRGVAMKLAAEYPVNLVCWVLGCSRSSYYYQAKSQGNQILQEAVEQVAATICVVA